MKALLAVIDFLQTVEPDFMSSGGLRPLKDLLAGMIDERTVVLRDEAELERTGSQEKKRGRRPGGVGETYLRVTAIACVEVLIQAKYKPPAARTFVADAFTTNGRKMTANNIRQWTRTWYPEQPVRDPESGAREAVIHAADAKASILDELKKKIDTGDSPERAVCVVIYATL